MKYGKFVILGLIALITFKVAFSLMGEIGGEEQKGNGLIVEPRTINLGTVVLNKGITFATSMRNISQKTTKLARIDRSCGCISVFPAKDTCQPGETVTLNGTLVPNKSGRFRYSVRLFEEDNSAPEHVIEVVGRAEPAAGSVAPSGSSSP